MLPIQEGARVRNKNGDSLPKTPLDGVVCTQWIRCSKSNCRCAAGRLHGPYFYRFFREAGKLKKKYVRHAELEQVRAQCEARRQARRELKAGWDTWRRLLAAVREVEKQGCTS